MSSLITVVGTGVLVALANTDDADHDACREWLKYTPATLVVPALGGSDAAVITLAERFNTDAVATLDHRHFTIVKPHHVKNLHLLP